MYFRHCSEASQGRPRQFYNLNTAGSSKYKSILMEWGKKEEGQEGRQRGQGEWGSYEEKQRKGRGRERGRREKGEREEVKRKEEREEWKGNEEGEREREEGKRIK